MTSRTGRAWPLAGAALLALSPATPAVAQATQAAQPGCEDGRCVYRVTAAELLAKAEQLVLARDFENVRPLIAALEQVPELQFQRRFLAGYVAVETGDLNGAVGQFRAILNDDPGQTRVRLELARALLMQGKEAAADHHFRLAAQDEELPEEVARTIRSARGIIRTRRAWHFNLDLGIAPDTNINNATAAREIEVRFGDATVPLQLDDEARARSGVGQTASISGGVRVRLDYDMALLIDGDAQGTNYRGSAFDDYWVQLAAGPEFRLNETSSLSVQAVAQQRWYGGAVATRQVGAKIGFQRVLDEGQRIGLQFDVRRTDSGFNAAYDGWQIAGYATYERVVHRSMIASATLYARRDMLASESYSSTDFGGEIGIGGELPHGINAGINAGLGHAAFDAPLLLFSDQERQDWKLSARAYVGLRSVRLLGFSPSATYSYNRVDTNYGLYRNVRNRLRLNLARYF